MSDAMLMTLGFDDFFWARPLSTPLMVAVFAAVLLLSVFLYRRAWGLPLWLRVLLGVARLVALALVVASLFEPTGVVKRIPHPGPHAAGLDRCLREHVDEGSAQECRRTSPMPRPRSGCWPGKTSNPSAWRCCSMPVSARRSSPPRASISPVAFSPTRRNRSSKSLGESLDISYHSFGGSPQVVSDASTVSADDLASLTATEPATSIAASLEAVAKSGVNPPAGIVLLTDGIDNASSQRTEAVLQDLGARGIPVFPVPIGLTEPDDVSIRNIVMQEVAFSGDSVPVQVQLLSKGYEKRTAPAHRHAQRPPGFPTEGAPRGRPAVRGHRFQHGSV